MQLDGPAELVGGGVRVALQQRRLGDRVGQRGERVGVARRGGDARQGLGAGVARRAVALRARNVAAQRTAPTA